MSLLWTRTTQLASIWAPPTMTWLRRLKHWNSIFLPPVMWRILTTTMPPSACLSDLVQWESQCLWWATLLWLCARNHSLANWIVSFTNGRLQWPSILGGARYVRKSASLFLHMRPNPLLPRAAVGHIAHGRCWYGHCVPGSKGIVKLHYMDIQLCSLSLKTLTLTSYLSLILNFQAWHYPRPLNECRGHQVPDPCRPQAKIS
jgi:hypothetical protein